MDTCTQDKEGPPSRRGANTPIETIELKPLPKNFKHHQYTLPRGLQGVRNLGPNDFRVVPAPPLFSPKKARKWKCTTQLIIIFSFLITCKVLLLTAFGCWMTSKCGFQTTVVNYTRNRSIHLTKRPLLWGHHTFILAAPK